MPAIDDRGEIDVDDVSLTQQIVVWNTVTNHFVDAGANRVRVAVVAQASGCVTVLDCVVVRQLVDFAGGDAGPDMRSEVVHEFGIESAGGSERVTVRVRRVDRNLGCRTSLWP